MDQYIAPLVGELQHIASINTTRYWNRYAIKTIIAEPKHLIEIAVQPARY